MANPTGFITIGRRLPERRPVAERLRDWHELEGKLPTDALQAQASRCMDCGVPFCHSDSGCPLGNLIPEWNDLVYRGDQTRALARLLATNNFPEITGRVCPAPCESACVLTGAGRQPVAIKQIEKQLSTQDALTPVLTSRRSGLSVGIVGSGPAGLAAAQQLARLGHGVTVYEREDAPGGLLRYGIPHFKLDRGVLDARLDQLRAEGVRFVVNQPVTSLDLPHDAVLLATGAAKARDLSIPGRALPHIELAMSFLTRSQRGVADVSLAGKTVVILGGGDTGSDCLGTALRLGAVKVLQLELMPRPPDVPANPWPEWPLVFRTSSSQEEGGERWYAVRTTAFNEKGIEAEVDGQRQVIAADLVLLALGFVGVDASFGLALDARGNIATDDYATSRPGVFACGDARKGASLVVHAIAEGRRAAAAIHARLASTVDGNEHEQVKSST